MTVYAWSIFYFKADETFEPFIHKIPFNFGFCLLIIVPDLPWTIWWDFIAIKAFSPCWSKIYSIFSADKKWTLDWADLIDFQAIFILLMLFFSEYYSKDYFTRLDDNILTDICLMKNPLVILKTNLIWLIYCNVLIFRCLIKLIRSRYLI